MHFADYQTQANTTDQMPLTHEDIKALMLPLLGLAGETGSLLTHYKRYLRDGEGYGFFRQRISEELGDILWNVANIATKTNLILEEVAERNLSKIRDRWMEQSAFFFSSRIRHTRWTGDWSSDVCSSDLSAGCTPRCTPTRRTGRPVTRSTRAGSP